MQPGKSLCLRALALAACGLVCAAAACESGGKVNCYSVAHSDHPHVRISNGQVDLFVFLPDKRDGYYRSSRFDWSGIIACAAYGGHTYFGEWFDHYDPLAHDAVTGPVEEFRGAPDEIGYADAAPGGVFVKIGVGLLSRVDEKPYDFKTVYPVVDPGTWTVTAGKRQIVFEQKFSSPTGVAYSYRKTLVLEPNAPVLRIEHRLTNAGSVPIHTEVYDHDFFMLDQQTTGPETTVTFNFAPDFESPLPEAARVGGTSILFERPLHPGEILRGGYFKGFAGTTKDYRILVENTDTGAGILQTADAPLSHAFFWATDRTVCPEAFIAVNAAPQASQEWTLHYQFLANAPQHPVAAVTPTGHTIR